MMNGIVFTVTEMAEGRVWYESIILRLKRIAARFLRGCYIESSKRDRGKKKERHAELSCET